VNNMTPEQEKTLREKWYKLHPEVKRIEDAAQRILEVSTELHLTWYELEKAVERVKWRAYISVPSEADATGITQADFERKVDDYLKSINRQASP